MYREFFKLRDFPFRLRADPAFLFLSDSHRRVRAGLAYAVDKREGIMVLTGPIGTGKSLLVKTVCETADRDIIHLHQTQLTAVELLQSILLGLGHHRVSDSKADLLAMLRRVLRIRAAAGRAPALIIDDAQNLPVEALEEVRMLADMELEGEQLLGLVLVGQPDLADTIAQPSLVQLAQRVILRTELHGLGLDETADYVRHRLGVASGGPREIFRADALRRIHDFTGGVPRRINVLCDMAMTGACVEDSHIVSARTVDRAAEELMWTENTPAADRRATPVAKTPAARPVAQGVTSMVPSADAQRNTERDVDAPSDRAVDASALVLTIAGFECLMLCALMLSGRESFAVSPVIDTAMAQTTQTEGGAMWIGDAHERGDQSAPGGPLADEATGAERGGLSRPADTPADTPEAQTEATVVAQAQDLPLVHVPAVFTETAAATTKPAATVVPTEQYRDTRVAGAANAVENAPVNDAALRDAQWLLAQPGEAFLIQLMSTRSRNELFRTSEQLTLPTQLAWYIDRDEITLEERYVLVTGFFDSYAQAESAVETLPRNVRRNGPWVRRVRLAHTAIVHNSADN